MICQLCPRKCNAVRGEEIGKGFCGMGTLPVVACVAPHYGEEPCISGERGSGTVFFSGCTMRCVYCQNHEISAGNKGKILTPEELAQCYRMLEESGVHNINLVTADHFAPAVAESLRLYRPRVPVVYNCSGYQSAQTLTLLNGLVDIYLTDFKYSDNRLAVKYSQAPRYVETALSAICEMLFQTGKPRFDADGMMQKGVLVRHLVLPSHTRQSIAALELLHRRFGDEIMVSLMCQYVPCGEAKHDAKLGRTVTRREYRKVTDALFSLGMDGFTQDLSSATKDFIPDWDFE
ncbi:MAG: radical SAM protein [Ruminococcus sp.]|nr:radical SAM protein [Ruminococcus sp.]